MSSEEIKDLRTQIEGLLEEIDELKQQIDDIENNEDSAVSEYDEMIDEQGVVEVGYITFSPSRVLKELDEIAYNCGYNDYFDERLSELSDEIEGKRKEIDELKKEIVELFEGCSEELITEFGFKTGKKELEDN
jgi:cell division protein FtsB